MIILDTNVLSEMLRSAPDARVSGWLAAQPVMQLFTTSVTEAEIRYGVARLPDEQRKAVLQSTVEGLFSEDLSGRILPFDTESAKIYAEIVSRRDRAGRPVSQFDAQIGAIARSRGAKLATRNIADFEDCDIDLINPWNL
jgi:predicted nucleic acid-binding protein